MTATSSPITDDVIPGGTIFALFKGEHGIPHLEIGTPHEMACHFADAESYYMADNHSGTFVRLDHQMASIGIGELHVWRYADSTWAPNKYIQPKDRPRDPATYAPDASYFKTLGDDLAEDSTHISRSQIFARIWISMKEIQGRNT